MKGNNTTPGFVSTQISVFLIYFISNLVCEILSSFYTHREKIVNISFKMLLENVGGKFKVVFISLSLDIENVCLDRKNKDIKMKNITEV